MNQITPIPVSETNEKVNSDNAPSMQPNGNPNAERSSASVVIQPKTLKVPLRVTTPIQVSNVRFVSTTKADSRPQSRPTLSSSASGFVSEGTVPPTIAEAPTPRASAPDASNRPPQNDASMNQEKTIPTTSTQAVSSPAPSSQQSTRTLHRLPLMCSRSLYPEAHLSP